jgi:hypothetical protein
MAYPKLNVEKVKAVLLENFGNTAVVAKHFGVSRQAVQQLIAKTPGLKDAAIEAKQTMIDHAESALHRKIFEGEAWAVCFFLKTQAKDRGYVERSELTGADGGAIEVSAFEKNVLKSYGEPDEQTVSSES